MSGRTAGGRRIGFVLASASPRRRQLLAGLDAALPVRPVAIDETPRAGEGPLACARRLASVKASAAAARLGSDDPDWALGSDTVVTIDGDILGKPADAAEAAAMLERLSGRRHEVVTAWALASRRGEVHVEHAVAGVRFRSLAAAEIDAYVASGDPLDKAGAYGIQGDAGRFVEALDGGFDVVMGLPVEAVLRALAERGAIPAFASEIALRRAALRGRIEAAARAAGRRGDEITLVAVSKQQPAGAVRRALEAGQRVFGESYVQEWMEKAAAVGEGPEWHFIGRLQRNKARFVAPAAALVHGLDSLRTAQALGRHAVAAGRELPVLAQVNVAGEATKAGVAPDELAAFLDAVAEIRGLAVRGLMTIPPPTGPGAARRCFAALRTLRDACATPERPLPILSMGMSDDFEAAIGEGATHVRIGTALFGPRPR